MFKMLNTDIHATEELTTLWGEVQGEAEVAAASTVTPDSEVPLRFGMRTVKLEATSDKVITIREAVSGETKVYTVYIAGMIYLDANVIAELCTLLHTASEGTKITININSSGGHLAGGSMIAGAISASKAEVTTVAVGLCGSAAALIWTYGHKRVIIPGTVLLFHMSSHGAWDQSDTIRIDAENLVRYVRETAIDPLVVNGIITEDEAEIILDKRRDLFLDSYTIEKRLAAASRKE